MILYCLFITLFGFSFPGHAAGSIPARVREELIFPAPDTLPQAFVPVTVRTPKLTISGGGTVIIPKPFTPVLVRTPLLTISGGGTVITPRPFKPVTVVIPKLTISGKAMN